MSRRCFEYRLLTPSVIGSLEKAGKEREVSWTRVHEAGGAHTRNGRSKVQGRGGLALKEGDGDGAVVLGLVGPCHIEGRAGSEDVTGGGLAEDVEAVDLGDGVAYQGQEGGGRGCEVHLGGSVRRVSIFDGESDNDDDDEYVA